MANSSIVMATYNGERYLKEQLDSIFINMNKDDELIISDDGSTDNTLKIIKEYQKKDKRIKLYDGPRLGVKQNFANAIQKASGKYIFLADQDDVWASNKMKQIKRIFKEEKCLVVVHNADIVDSDLKELNKTFFEFRNSGSGIIKNIWKNTYIGCCMAFSASLKDKILPIPNDIEMHDQWIGLIGEKYGKSVFLDDCLIKYRRHESNLSKMEHHSLGKMIKNRIKFIKNYIKIR